MRRRPRPSRSWTRGTTNRKAGRSDRRLLVRVRRAQRSRRHVRRSNLCRSGARLRSNLGRSSHQISGAPRNLQIAFTRCTWRHFVNLERPAVGSHALPQVDAAAASRAAREQRPAVHCLDSVGQAQGEQSELSTIQATGFRLQPRREYRQTMATRRTCRLMCCDPWPLTTRRERRRELSAGYLSNLARYISPVAMVAVPSLHSNRP